jgi:DNA-binding transcriptional regulator LsrR (DeoR family)
VARKYFLERKLKREIADDLGISRFKVARLLRSAIDDGVVRVRIEVSDPEGVDGELSARVQVAYGLRTAVVVRELPDQNGTMRAVAKAAAEVVAESLEPEDILGISWGRALNVMVDMRPALPPCPIVQIAGGSGDWEPSINAVDLVRRAGTKTGGRVYALHAPLAVADAELALALRADPSISRTLAMFPAVTKAVIGIGAWRPPGSTIRDILEDEDRRLLEELGVVGDACGIFVADGGVVVESPLNDRLIAIRENDLRRVPEVIAVTHGVERSLGVRAVLQARLVTTLVTDAGVGQELLRMHDAHDGT